MNDLKFKPPKIEWLKMQQSWSWGLISQLLCRVYTDKYEKLLWFYVFSALCIFYWKDSSAWNKHWKTQNNSWNSVRLKNTEILRNPKKYLKNLLAQKNRIWPNFKPKKIGRTSLRNQNDGCSLLLSLLFLMNKSYFLFNIRWYWLLCLYQ